LITQGFGALLSLTQCLLLDCERKCYAIPMNGANNIRHFDGGCARCHWATAPISTHKKRGLRIAVKTVRIGFLVRVAFVQRASASGVTSHTVGDLSSVCTSLARYSMRRAE
jgi:hypothetical protein